MRITVFALSVAVLLLVTTLVASGANGQSPSGPPAGAVPSITFQAAWQVKGSVTESHTTIYADGGVTVFAGAVLTLNSVTLQMNETKNLAEGLVIRTGGSL